MNWIIGAVLSIPIMLVIQQGVTGFVDARVRETIEVASGRKLVVLAGQVATHVHANYGTVASGEIALSTLEGEELIPDGFGAGDAMKRGLKIWVLRNADRLRVATMQVVAAGDDRWPGAAVFEARDAQHLGVVDGNGMLRGPTINEDLSAFQAVAGGDPKRFALVVYQEFDRESVCGDYLFRRDRPGCPDGAVMETDLDLDGHDIEGVGRLEAQTLEVSETVVVGGDFRIEGEFAVGRAVRVEGSASFPGDVAFEGDAEFTGSVTANGIDVAGLLTADGAEIGRDVTAESIVAGGNMTAPGATVTTIDAGTGQIGTLTVGSCVGC